MALPEIVLSAANVTAKVVPGRGALVTQLRVGDREVLYLDPATVEDPTRSVRGGIPLLFPQAGGLADDTLGLTGTKLKQHGFARDRAWTVRAMLRRSRRIPTSTRLITPCA